MGYAQPKPKPTSILTWVKVWRTIPNLSPTNTLLNSPLIGVGQVGSMYKPGTLPSQSITDLYSSIFQIIHTLVVLKE